MGERLKHKEGAVEEERAVVIRIQTEISVKEEGVGEIRVEVGDGESIELLGGDNIVIRK